MTEHLPRRHILLPGDLFPAIDEYRFTHRIENRTQAIERLIRAGLDAEAPFDAAGLTVTHGPSLHEERPKRRAG